MVWIKFIEASAQSILVEGFYHSSFGGAGMAQCWEHSLPTNVVLVWFQLTAMCGLSLLLVLVLLWGFCSMFSRFLPPQKPTSSNSNLTRIDQPMPTQMYNLECTISNILFSLFFFVTHSLDIGKNYDLQILIFRPKQYFILFLVGIRTCSKSNWRMSV